MSFLTPLYIAALAAISLPILFHLMRRTPKTVQTFSSLMFLAPTPPRLTRRSRLDQLLLLLMRAAAICLLAFAFARPFLRQLALTDSLQVTPRRVAVLIDTSASMQRAGIWQRVTEELETVLEGLGPRDQIALYRAAATTERMVDLKETESLALSAKQDLLRKRFRQLRPGWESIELGKALIQVADELDSLTDPNSSASRRQIVLISDLPDGSMLESLQGYQWPAVVTTDLRQVAPSMPGNATLQLLETSREADARGAKVRVANTEESEQLEFTVGWSNSDQQSSERPDLGTTVSVAVPPGQTRVVHVPMPKQLDRTAYLQLMGDHCKFDDRFFVVTAPPQPRRIVYRGTDSPDDPEGLLYYLVRAVTNDPDSPVIVDSDRDATQKQLESSSTALAVFAGPLKTEVASEVRAYLGAGGTALIVLTTPADAAVAAEIAEAALDSSAGDVTAADFVLWSDIDFEHYLFRPFAGPQFNDFSRIHFWQYRRLAIPTNSKWRAIVSFDNGDPALLETPVGTGTLFLLTAGWQPDESQLARSSKFVPLLNSMLTGSSVPPQSDLVVGQPITLSSVSGETASTVTKPDGSITPLSATQTEYSDTDIPGLYLVKNGEKEQHVAVNIARSESRTTPLDAAALEQYGVQLQKSTTYSDELKTARQMRDIELEARQGVWQWLIAAAFLLLIGETVLGAVRSQQVTHAADVPESSDSSFNLNRPDSATI